MSKGLPYSLDDLYGRVSKLESGDGSAKITVASISDASDVGKSVLVAADRPAARTALNLDRVQQTDTETQIKSADGNVWFYTGSSGTGIYNSTTKTTKKLDLTGVAVADLATGADAAAIVTGFNALLKSLRDAGIIAS